LKKEDQVPSETAVEDALVWQTTQQPKRRILMINKEVGQVQINSEATYESANSAGGDAAADDDFMGELGCSVCDNPPR
jgi:hypothetical protein